jgi:hypothetical protein
MSFDLAAVLPLILPRAVEWVEQHAALVAATGEPLDELGLSLARRVGVMQPERIRVLHVPTVAMPEDPLLRQAALLTDFLGPDTLGLTLGHSIYLCHGERSARLLSHECRHVYQYERAGSIARYLPIYFRQIIEHGYEDAPFEVDARAHELDG